MNLPTPIVEYDLLSPMLIVFGVAILGVLVEAFLPRERRYAAQLALSFCGLVAALIAVVALVGHHGSAVMGSVMVDGPTLFFQGAILVMAILALATVAEQRLGAFTPQGSAVPGSEEEQQAIRHRALQTEIFPMSMLAVGGMLIFCSAADLVTIFVALEVFSLPLYVLCGLARHRRLLSQEAALKYFLLGAFSSAFFLYGVVMLYGFAGTLTLSGIAEAVKEPGTPTSLAVVGMALLVAGMLFKIGAVPFHSWVPDVYQGSPTPITGFMAATVKLAAFGALMRILYVALPGLVADWRPLLWGCAAVTMVLAAVLTVTQTDIKRLLAYSSVTNVGFLLAGASAAHSGLSSTMFYLVAYGFSTLGAFTTVSLIRDAHGQEDTDTTRWAGLGWRSPAIAGLLALFLLGIAGIPLTSGFVTKFAILGAAATSGALGLVVVGAISSVIAAVAYARVISRMFFTEPGQLTPMAVAPAPATKAAVAVAAAATVLIGLAPQPVIDLADHAGQFMR